MPGLPVPAAVELALTFAMSCGQVTLLVSEAGWVVARHDTLHIVPVDRGRREAIIVHRTVECTVPPLATSCARVGPERCSGERPATPFLAFPEDLRRVAFVHDGLAAIATSLAIIVVANVVPLAIGFDPRNPEIGEVHAALRELVTGVASVPPPRLRLDRPVPAQLGVGC